MITSMATEARKDIGAFHHNAVLALTDRGIKRAAIGEALGISERTVRRYQNTPCPAYEREKRQREERLTKEAVNRTATPFLSLEEIQQEDAMRNSRRSRSPIGKKQFTREAVFALHSEGLSGANIAQSLGITRQAVSKHLVGIAQAMECPSGEMPLAV